MEPPTSAEAGATLPSVPGYEVLGLLGRGGMGAVYKARQVKLNRLVALKMILAGAHAGLEERARFQSEAEAVARLQHPNWPVRCSVPMSGSRCLSPHLSADARALRRARRGQAGRSSRSRSI
jgi:serine/threonine protein kinase